jgi:hypothetical protein
MSTIHSDEVENENLVEEHEQSSSSVLQFMRSESFISFGSNDDLEKDIEVQIERSVHSSHSNDVDPRQRRKTFLILALTCVGVVYGDLATSPL